MGVHCFPPRPLGHSFCCHSIRITNTKSNMPPHAMPVVAALAPFVAANAEGRSFDLESMKTSVKDAVSNLDLVTIGTILLVAVGLILLWDLIVFLFSAATGRSLSYASPMVGKAAIDAWRNREEITNFIDVDSRSLDEYSPILNAIDLAIAKYEDMF